MRKDRTAFDRYRRAWFRRHIDHATYVAIGRELGVSNTRAQQLVASYDLILESFWKAMDRENEDTGFDALQLKT